MLNTKTLVIARHGEPGTDGLSPIGLRNSFTRAAYLSFYMHPKPLDGIVHSPTTRTTYTAKAFSRYFSRHVNAPDHPPVMKSCDVLATVNRMTFADLMHELPDEWNNVCLVSHMPNITDLIHDLTYRPKVLFREGDAAILTFNTLRWRHISTADKVEYLKGSTPIGQIGIPDLHELVKDL
jgi:phosphohistidine phosphatase SixA